MNDDKDDGDTSRSVSLSRVVDANLERRRVVFPDDVRRHIETFRLYYATLLGRLGTRPTISVRPCSSRIHRFSFTVHLVVGFPLCPTCPFHVPPRKCGIIYDPRFTSVRRDTPPCMRFNESLFDTGMYLFLFFFGANSLCQRYALSLLALYDDDVIEMK